MPPLRLGVGLADDRGLSLRDGEGDGEMWLLETPKRGWFSGGGAPGNAIAPFPPGKNPLNPRRPAYLLANPPGGEVSPAPGCC